MSYETQCWELARPFLEDAHLDLVEHQPKLAQVIQTAIEDYLDRVHEGSTGEEGHGPD